MKKFYIVFGGLVVALFAMGQSSGPVEIRRGGGGSSGVSMLNGTATNLQVYSSGTTNRPLRVFGGSQTNSNPTQILNTWNNSGATFTGFEVVATNTAAAVGSIVARFGASDMGGGSFPLTVYDRYTRFGSYGTSSTYDARVEGVTGGTDIVAYDNNTRGVGLSYTGVNIKSSLGLLWWSGAAYSGAVDSAIYRNSAGILEINNGTAGQYRDLRLRTLYGEGGTVTASQPVLDISQTWNNAGVNFTAAKVNVTNTASAVASLLLDLQLDGTSKFSVAKDGAINFGSPVGVGAITRTGIANSANGISIFPNSPYAHFAFSGSTMSFFTIGGSVPTISFVNGGGTADAGMSRNTAGIIEVNNGTVGQYRDLVTRSTFATNASITNITADSYVTTQQTLSYASATNLTVDANKSLHFVSLTNTAYFAQPSNLGVGRTFTVILQQDGTGTRAVTFNTNYWKFPGGVVPTITTNANAYDVLSCISCPYGTNVFAIHNAKFQ